VYVWRCVHRGQHVRSLHSHLATPPAGEQGVRVFVCVSVRVGVRVCVEVCTKRPTCPLTTQPPRHTACWGTRCEGVRVCVCECVCVFLCVCLLECVCIKANRSHHTITSQQRTASYREQGVCVGLVRTVYIHRI